MEFLCFADIIHHLEWRKAASRSRGKESLASQNTGKKNHPPRAVVLWKTEESEVKRSMWLAIKTEGAELEERERVQRAKE
jgi:hypothetical protein